LSSTYITTPPPPTSTLFPYTTLFRSKFPKEAFIQRKTVGPGTIADVAISPDPQQRFLYIPDINNDFIWILSRDSFQVLGKFGRRDRKSTRLNSSHVAISYAVFCLKKK